MTHEPVVRTVIEPAPYTSPRIKIGVVQIDDQKLVLSAREFIIWDALYRRLGKIISLDVTEPLAMEWGNARQARPWHDTAKVYLSRLREKIADQGLPFTILTVQGVGHSLILKAEEDQ